jgi:hypothetical protein
MSTYMSAEVLSGLEAARKTAHRRRNRLHARVGDRILPIVTFDETGFTVGQESALHLRGLVDIYDGPKHVYQALIVASELDGDLMRYDFKRATLASDLAPLDYERAGARISGFLTQAGAVE